VQLVWSEGVKVGDWVMHLLQSAWEEKIVLDQGLRGIGFWLDFDVG
jgi:hypothetical protein